MTKYLSSIDLKQNQLKNTVIHNLASAPSNPKNGQIYYNTTDKKFCIYENDSWKSYTTLEEIQENYYNKSEIDNIISSVGGFPDQTNNEGKVLTTDGTSPSWNHIINMNNVTESTSGGLSNLVINKLTQAEYDELLANDQINDNELYTITDANTFFATKDEIPTLTSQLTNDSGFITEIPSEYITETELNEKGYLTEHQDISGKADITYLNTRLEAKADVETTYTKTEVDDLISNIDVDSLPSQTDNAGKVLTTDGTDASWDYIIDVNNVTESTTENLSKLVINKLTQVEYDELLANDQINDNEIYLTTDDADVPTKISELENDIGFITATDIESKAETTYVDEQIQNTNNTISSIQTYVNENIYTKEEVDNKILTVYKFKGTVDSEDNLPSTAENGDVYNTTDTGMNYAWNGTEWDALGSDVDLSSYLTKEEATNIYALNSDVETLRNTTYNKTEVDELINGLSIPTKTSELTNDSGFITTTDIESKANKEETYSKIETDELLEEKANVTDVYTKIETDELLNVASNDSEKTNCITEIPQDIKLELNDIVEYYAWEPDDEKEVVIYTKTPEIEVGTQLYNASYEAIDTIPTVNSDTSFTYDGVTYTRNSEYDDTVRKIILKAGSKVWIPYGTTEAYQVGDADAYNHTVVATSWDGSKFFYAIELQSDIAFGGSSVTDTKARLLYFSLPNTLGTFRSHSSGTTTPSTGTNQVFYNTQDNTIKRYTDGTDLGFTYSLPIAMIIANGSSTVGSIYQIFNGFNYIGSTIFTLPNIKMLASNGRNEDGTYRNFNLMTDKVFVKQYTATGFSPAFMISALGNISGIDYIINPTVGSTPPAAGWFYNTNTNRVYHINGNVWKEQPWIMFGYVTTQNGVIQKFTPATTFRAVDYNDLQSSSINLKVPIGSIIAFAANSTPNGYLICNGGAISRTTYADLFDLIGTTYGSGDGSTTFNVPNLTDKFIQGSGTAGTTKAAGLPNIYGKSTGFESESGSNTTNGAIKTFKTGTGWGGGSERDYRGIEFNASWYNSIYGASSTVQPPALTMRFYIKY